MSVARALALNTIIQVAGKVVSTITGILIISLMTRRLGAAGFGDYSTANAVLQVFALMMDLGINVTFPAMLGERSNDPAFQQRAFASIFTLRVVMSVVVLLGIAPLVGFLWPFPWQVKLAIVALSLSYVFPGIQQILIGVQQQRLRMTLSTVAENVGRLTTIAGLLVSPYFGWGVVAQCWIISASSAVVFAINAWSTHRFLPIRWRWDPPFWMTVLKRSWPVGVSIALNLIYYKADALILQYFRPAAEVGVYGAAYRILEVLITIPFLYAGVLLPVLSRTWEERKPQEMSQLISRSLDVMLLLIIPLIVGVRWFGVPMMTFISGPEFAFSGFIARILMLGVAAIYLNTILSHAIVALQAQRKMLPAYALVAALTLAGYLFYIPQAGATAAAWLTVFSEVSILLASTLTVWGYVRFAPSGRTLVGSLASAVCMWGVAAWTQSFPLLAGIMMSGCTYVIALALTKTVTPTTVKNLLSIKDPGMPPARGA
jgi:O-antigen/teichoic acid export membrane protein